MKIDEVELRLVRLPYRAPFRTSFGEESEKHALIVTVRSDGVEGYGEGVMDMLPAYREESIPGALLPKQPDGTPYYSTSEIDVLRISSKSHWDIPIQLASGVVHLLVSHPTPPAFDSPSR